jgi:diguanylate cyclase (GGDEF)-like protein/PAS domain S-box-containing protein
MIRSLKGNLWRLISFGMAAALLLFLFFKAQPVSPDAHNLLTSDLRELQARDIELGEAVLRHHYQLFHNYDGVVFTMQRMQALSAALLQSLQNGSLPDKSEVRHELKEIQQAINLKSAALDEFKSDNAVSKTALIYLPVTIDAIEQQLPGASRLLQAKFNHLLRDALLLTTGQNGNASEALEQDIAAVDKAIYDLPGRIRALAVLSVKHAKNILENENDMATSIEQLSSYEKPHIGTKLEQLYLDYYQKQQHSASIYRLFLLLAAVLTLGYAFYAYYEMIEKAAQLRIAATAFNSQESVMITDANGVILRVNQAFTDSTGYTSEEAVGQTPRILKSGRHDAEFYRAMWEAIAKTGTWQGEIWNRRKSGEIYPLWHTISSVKGSDGVITHYVGSHIDITERKAAEEKIRQLAFHDSLTRLPNRQLLLDRLQQALVSSSRSGQLGALLFIDLDNFKTLNDTLGHLIGDLLLQQVAERLTSCVREGDTVSRIGGDEFVVMLEGLSKSALEAAAQTEIIGGKIFAHLSKPYQLESNEYRCTTSIGATLFTDKHQPLEELLKQADIAMYQAKKAGRNTLRFFDPQMQETINIRAALENDLNKAIENRQLNLFYQIQVDSSRRPLGAEALVRWSHPERGLVSPAQFIPLAEETGLILPIGQWVLETACAQLKTWEQNVLTRDLVLAVNVSPREFRQAAFVAQLQAVIQRHGINPQLLKLELTESLFLEDIGDTISTMNALNEIGVQFSLDDFGTGYSSLQYLKQLPLDQLKIDQSFVRDITTDTSDKEIVRTIIAMARSLNLDVIAEGVETEAQRQLLMENGCTRHQGYLFSKPVPIEQFEALLKQG